MLSQMQTDIAVILKMKRGTNYAKERKPRPKRLDSYEYKEAKELESQARARAEAEAQAKIKDLKEEVARARAELQGRGAKRADYAELEQLNRELKEKIKSKDLTIVELKAELIELKAQLFEPKEAKEAQETVSIPPKPRLDLDSEDFEELKQLKKELRETDRDLPIARLELAYKKLKRWADEIVVDIEQKQLKTPNKPILSKKRSR
jgi:multidrug efflux pump subunit AcrA (membrane-fusion protein)